MKILSKFNELKLRPSDINEHLDALKEYAEKCNHVTEMGVREAVATYAFLVAAPNTLISYDLYTTPGVQQAIALAHEKGLNFKFIQADVLKVDIEPTEMLFIDTFHVYNQLKQELELHADKVSKYLVFHDTVSYAHKDEKGYWVTPEMIANYKYQGKEGLLPAIEEFMAENPHWVIEKHFTNNNGLMILKRV
jgi:hypothetical protein